MAGKRRKTTQAKRRTTSSSKPWLWVMVGAIVSAGVFVGISVIRNQSPTQFLHVGTTSKTVQAPVPTATVPAIHATKKLPTPSGGRTKFDFYTVLPNTPNKVQSVSPAPSVAKDNERDRALAALNNQVVPARMAHNNVPPTPPHLLTSSMHSQQSSTVATSSQTSLENTRPGTQKGTTNTSKIAPAMESPTKGRQYVLQAGSYGGQTDAESIKARLAMLGLHAHIESAHIGHNKIVYRVRIGPYGSGKELADAKQKLSANGVTALTIPAQ